MERSRSGRGAHLWIFFKEMIPARLARRFGFAMLEKGAESVNLKSFKYYDRILPAQDTLDDGKIGNLIALPLQKLALSEGNSAFIDENWNAYPDQWRTLESKPSLSQEFLEAADLDLFLSVILVVEVAVLVEKFHLSLVGAKLEAAGIRVHEPPAVFAGNSKFF